MISLSRGNKYISEGQPIDYTIESLIDFEPPFKYHGYLCDDGNSKRRRFDLSEFLNDQQLLELVREKPFTIEYVIEPSEILQMVSIEVWPDMVRLITNPSYTVMMTAVQQDGYVLGCIKKPNAQIQLAAVTQCGLAIKFIENPTEQMKLAAVTQNGFAVYYIKKVSKQVQIAAYKHMEF